MSLKEMVIGVNAMDPMVWGTIDDAICMRGGVDRTASNDFSGFDLDQRLYVNMYMVGSLRYTMQRFTETYPDDVMCICLIWTWPMV